MSDILFKDAFDIYQKQSDSIHKLWAYFQVVSLAVLGYTIGSDKSRWSSDTYLLIAGSYLFFALANQWVIFVSQKELRKFGGAVELASKNTGPVGEKFVVEAVRPWVVVLFHFFSTAVVVTAILATWHDKCSAPGPCPAPAAMESKSS